MPVKDYRKSVMVVIYSLINDLGKILSDTIDINLSTISRGDGGDFCIYVGKDKNLVARFSLTQMPGCCGICVSYHSHVYYSYRRKGIGKLLTKFRIDLARAYGYGTLICTDVDTNEPQKKILRSTRWRKLYSFVNPRSRNTVNIHIKKL